MPGSHGDNGRRNDIATSRDDGSSSQTDNARDRYRSTKSSDRFTTLEDEDRATSTAYGGERGGYGRSAAQTGEYGSSRGGRGPGDSIGAPWSAMGGAGGQARSRGTGPHSGRGPKGYQRSDTRITEDVNDALTHHGDVDATDITVSVENGEVTLSGTVETRAMKRAAEDALEDVRGIRDVHNQLRVGAKDDAPGTSATGGRGSKH